MRFLITLLFSGLFCGISARGLDKNWWKSTEIYDIVVSAFKDIDGDGFGDFEGIVSKLDYIKGLGVHAIKLSPIFASSEEASKTYPIEDFKNTHLASGSLEEFDELVKQANVRGLQVILDLVINHCSVQHEWFKKSQNRIEPYTDYFIWTAGDKNISTSDSSVSGVWELDETRKQYFYHRFDKTTADLNLKNEAVRKEIKNIMKFWLDRGVSGFNLLSANVYVEDELAKQYEYPLSNMLEDRPESYEFVHELRNYVNDYNQQKGGNERVLILEQRAISKFPNLRGNETYPIAHIITKNFFGYDNYEYYKYFKSSYVNDTITNIMEELKNGPAMYILEDSTLVRTPNRFQDRQYLDVWLTTLFMLPGIIHIYYGQEIGISTWRFANDVKITAMHWDNTINAGFTSSEMSIYAPNVDYWKVNVKDLKNAEFSTLESMRDLLKLRKTRAVQNGDLKTYKISDYVFAFSRSYRNQEKFIAILNLSNELYTVDLKRDLPEYTPSRVRVVSSSPNSIHRTGDVINKISQITLRPVSTVVVSIK